MGLLNCLMGRMAGFVLGAEMNGKNGNGNGNDDGIIMMMMVIMMGLRLMLTLSGFGIARRRGGFWIDTYPLLLR
jgi:hypothetical protein